MVTLYWNIYTSHSKMRSPSQIEVEFGKVVRATPVFLWAVGLPVETVMKWVERKGMCACETIDPSSGLKDKPTDAQLARRLQSV
jgi:hypothetical protein